MNIDELKSNYPKLFSKLPDDVSALRYILVIDENFNDVDSDEFDVIDSEDFNYMVYMTELLQESIGAEVFDSLADKYEALNELSDYYDAGGGLHGVMTELGEDDIAKLFLAEIEQSL